jgi:hypothetical protein
VLDQSFDASSGPVTGLQVLGIEGFVQARRDTVAAQLKAEPSGHSGIDFNSNQWSFNKAELPETGLLAAA